MAEALTLLQSPGMGSFLVSKGLHMRWLPKGDHAGQLACERPQRCAPGCTTDWAAGQINRALATLRDALAPRHSMHIGRAHALV